MRNAPPTFQRLMQKVLSDVQQCKAYLDDVVVYSNCWEDHFKTLEIIFTRLGDASLSPALANSHFAKFKVIYFGEKR